MKKNNWLAYSMLMTVLYVPNNIFAHVSYADKSQPTVFEKIKVTLSDEQQASFKRL